MSISTESDEGSTDDEIITIGTTAGGDDIEIPVVDILTGRAFITGKSGSGKSNSMSVVAEELLDAGYPLMIVDTDGEYYGLKETYEILHAGADEQADIQVGPEHAAKLAELALEQGVPIILDVSGYLDEDVAAELIRETARELFTREKEQKTPFLLVIEEIHEYIPEGGGLDDVGKMLIKISKRGRKHGLGIAGVSQRPADVKKDFITQANWLLWHRLTWDNDTKVVRRVVSASVADDVGDLNDGEAFIQADWREEDVERIQVRRKKTFDAGATPGLDDFERPDLKSLDEDLLGDLEEISDRHDQRSDEIDRLEAQLEDRDERIQELEAELENQENISSAAQQMADALRKGSDADAVPEDFDEQLATKSERIQELEAQLTDVEDERDELRDRVEELESEVDRLQVAADRIKQAEEIERQLEEAREVLGVEVEASLTPATDNAEADDLRGRLQDAHERIDDLELENDHLREQTNVADGGLEPISSYSDFLEDPDVKEAIEEAKSVDRTSPRYVKGVIASIIDEGGSVHYEDIAQRLDLSGTTAVSKAASVLEAREIIEKDQRDDGMHVDLNTDGHNAVREAAARRRKTEEVMESL